MKDENTQEVAVVAEMDLVAPASAEKILDAFKAFEWMKQNIITSNDRQRIAERQYIKKSGWMKIALACNISLEKREERVEQHGDETVYHYTYRAIAPSGRFADADASASTAERKFTHLPHDVRTLAQTRACNRCVSNLCGGGEVSFEELTSQDQPPEDLIVDNEIEVSASVLNDVVLKDGWNWNRVISELGEDIQAKQKELGEDVVTFESAAVIVAREKGITNNPAPLSKELLPEFEKTTASHNKDTIDDAIEGLGDIIKDGDLEVSVEDGKVTVKPTKFLATHIWNTLNQALWKAGLRWTKNGKAGYWSGSG
ncbi:MAG: hypothetical protein KGD60_14890 [Candidatus Thorarchaeota archaeon]|nr:hypothetical protein [Candidatus Thorarchaeota archaeon]